MSNTRRLGCKLLLLGVLLVPTVALATDSFSRGNPCHAERTLYYRCATGGRWRQRIRLLGGALRVGSGDAHSHLRRTSASAVAFAYLLPRACAASSRRGCEGIGLEDGQGAAGLGARRPFTFESRFSPHAKVRYSPLPVAPFHQPLDHLGEAV